MEDAWKTSKYVLKITLNMLKMLENTAQRKRQPSSFDTPFLDIQALTHMIRKKSKLNMVRTSLV